jgi:hydrogenase maturation protein HypF
LFRHSPEILAVDLHPGYRSTQLGRDLASREGVDVTAVQHHHAHIASVLAENGWPLDGGPVLGIAVDGLGYGADGTIWGGELLVADYSGYRRVGRLALTPMPGGVKAILEPWRCTYAQLRTHLGWDSVRECYGGLELLGWLDRRPLPVLEQMMASGLNTPLTSSAGRLFDAVAAALGLCRETIAYEGQAAVELEALARRAWPREGGYPFGVGAVEGVEVIDPAPMWAAVLDDLAVGADPALIAARFHRGFADVLAELAGRLCLDLGLRTVALSGGVFQNRTLLEALSGDLREGGLSVLGHRRVPTNDGGISLGQAAVASARALLG